MKELLDRQWRQETGRSGMEIVNIDIYTAPESFLGELEESLRRKFPLATGLVRRVSAIDANGQPIPQIFEGSSYHLFDNSFIVAEDQVTEFRRVSEEGGIGPIILLRDVGAPFIGRTSNADEGTIRTSTTERHGSIVLGFEMDADHLHARAGIAGENQGNLIQVTGNFLKRYMHASVSHHLRST